MSDQEKLKARAAEHVLSLIHDDMIIGLGTGSTAKYFLHGLAAKIQNGELKNIKGIPSSRQTEKIANELHIPLTSFDEHQTLDITIDGADEVDPDFNLIKGGGGALLREKIMAQASTRFVVIIDESKYSDRLGTLFFVPVEVLPYALPLELKFLKELGAEINIRQLENGNYFKTDQENYILDCHFGPIEDPDKLNHMLNMRAGIMEHGLFLSMANDVVMATEQGIKHLVRE
jgi:ribose 5-phosphate isomerase A